MTQPTDTRAPQPFGKYVLHERLGAGGMAEVFRATLGTVDGFEKTLVIKRVRPDRLDTERFREMFVNEARLVSGLVHPNIVQVFELGQVGEEHFIAMEWVDGWDLLTVLARAATSKQPMPVGVALHIVANVCAALEYAHDVDGPNGEPLRLVHHDVTPSNVLIARHGGVKLADFGLAGLSGDEADRGSKKLKGKVSYMPPEKVKTGQMDHRGDVFAVGVMLYEALTMKRLLRGKSVEDTLRNVIGLDVDARLAKHTHIPGRLADVIRGALCVDPDLRYQTAGDLREDLEDLRFELGLRVTDRDVATFVGEVCGTGAPRRKSGIGDSSLGWSSCMGSTSGSSSTQFVVQQPGGSVGRPLRRPTIQRLVQARAISPDDPVSVNGGPFTSARRQPQLSDAMMQAWCPPTGAPTAKGGFGWSVAAALLTRLALKAQTGRLELKNGKERKAVYLMKGRVVAVESNRSDELLGARLLREGTVSAIELEAALGESSSGDMALGGALLQLGYLKPEQLINVLTQQMEDRLAHAVAWDEGTFEWFAGIKAAPANIMGRSDPRPMAAGAICRLVLPDSLAAWLAANGDPVLQRAEVPPFDSEELRLKGPVHRQMATLPLNQPASRLISAQRDATTRDATTQALFLMLQTGLATASRH